MQPLEHCDPVQIGPYRLLGRLGAGGMGQVYRGRSPGGRAVAVKVVHQHLLAGDPAFRSRFRREMDAAKRVGGFYTAAVVDGDADADSPWYASAYIDAPTLADVLRSDGPLSEEQALELGAGLAEALAAIHKAGLVHRDLKPANVLLAADGPRVIDFGIVRMEHGGGGRLTGTGNFIGTPGYLSPEQLNGTPVTGASDVFALGALLAFATTGRMPFPGLPQAAIITSTLHMAPDIAGVPGRLREITRQMPGQESTRPSDPPDVARTDVHSPFQPQSRSQSRRRAGSAAADQPRARPFASRTAPRRSRRAAGCAAQRASTCPTKIGSACPAEVGAAGPTQIGATHFTGAGRTQPSESSTPTCGFED